MGPLSILGSSLILLTVYRTKKISGPKAINTYHRLLSCIGIFDILFSIGLTLGPLPMPSNLGIPGAHGNTGTCSLQGFLLQVGYAKFAYSASLMIYYVLILRFRLRNSVMVKYVEPCLHAGPLLFHLITGTLGFFWEIYNPQSALCWVGVYPPYCNDIEDVACERGEEHVEIFGMWMGVYPSLFYTGIIVCCLIVVIWTVTQKYLAGRQFSFQGSAPNRAQQERVRLVVTQSLLYGFFFLNVTFWGIAGTIVDLSGRQLDFLGEDFWLACITLSLFPLQGFFFFLIYIRPRYLTLRRRSNLGRWRALIRSIWEPESRVPTSASVSQPSGEGSSQDKNPPSSPLHDVTMKKSGLRKDQVDGAKDTGTRINYAGEDIHAISHSELQSNEAKDNGTTVNDDA